MGNIWKEKSVINMVSFSSDKKALSLPLAPCSEYFLFLFFCSRRRRRMNISPPPPHFYGILPSSKPSLWCKRGRGRGRKPFCLLLLPPKLTGAHTHRTKSPKGGEIRQFRRKNPVGIFLKKNYIFPPKKVQYFLSFWWIHWSHEWVVSCVGIYHSYH